MTISWLWMLWPLLASHSSRSGDEAHAPRHERAAVASPVTSRASADSALAHETAVLHISEFNALWQRAWRNAEDFRARHVARQTLDRALRLWRQHCHQDSGDDDGRSAAIERGTADSSERDRLIFSVIPSSQSAYATCPSWLLTPGIGEESDETTLRDGALLSEQRPMVVRARASLLRELDSTALKFPGNVWLTGQRTRLYLDQNDPASALSAAQSCKGEAWWCAALTGYVHARNAQIALAEVAFDAMHESMPARVACDWDDVRRLFQPSERGKYAKLSCQQRMELNKRFWWLSDPLFRTRLNERRVEDDMRRVEVELHKAVGRDERYTWAEKDGGDALAELVERYGWPSYAANMPANGERGHNGYLNSDRPPAYRLSPRMTPYTTFEYSMDRVRTAPRWSMLEAPFSAPDSAWILRAETSSGSPVTGWWPAEHYRPERPIVQLFEGQTGLFRRQSQVLLASALQLNHPSLKHTGNAPYDVMMLASSGPGHLDSIATAVDSAGAKVVLRGLIAPAPYVVSIEARETSADGIDARSRFGATPPKPLAAMTRGEIAISDPVLLELGVGESAPVPDEGVLLKMKSTTRLGGANRRVALYWETYGLSATDTIKVSVRLVGERDLTLLERVAVAMRVGNNPNATVIQEWTEPDAQRGTRTIAGVVPIQMRTIVLNLSQLQSGPYRIVVGIARKEGIVAAGQRRVLVEQ